MRHFLTFGTIALIAVACGGTSTIGHGNGSVDEGDGGNTGGSNGGGSETGGKPGVVADGGGSTGGSTGGECKSGGECAVPAICKQCPDGTYSCAKADCVEGQCRPYYPECQGGGCTSASDCPQSDAPCQLCSDGSYGCPTTDCVNGSCVASFGGCGGTTCDPAFCPSDGIGKPCCLKGGCAMDWGSGCGVPSGSGCTSDSECPVTNSCMPCPDGSCAPQASYCMNGQCVMKIGACDTPLPTGELTWYKTCGDVVCGGPGGVPADVPKCDPAFDVAGKPCQVDGELCDAGDSCGVLLQCTKEDPTHGGVCPISRAKYKQDIQYVSQAERAKLADEIQSIPLVRYRYKDGPAREHLGFIIEDIEPSASVDSARDRVDLYGYTSMAVAALQQQHTQIEALRREVEALRGELSRRPR